MIGTEQESNAFTELQIAYLTDSPIDRLGSLVLTDIYHGSASMHLGLRYLKSSDESSPLSDLSEAIRMMIMSVIVMGVPRPKHRCYIYKGSCNQTKTLKVVIYLLKYSILTRMNHDITHVETDHKMVTMVLIHCENTYTTALFIHWQFNESFYLSSQYLIKFLSCVYSTEWW